MSEMQDPSQNSARKAWLRRKQPYERAMKELANAHVVVSAEMADVLKTCLQVGECISCLPVLCATQTVHSQNYATDAASDVQACTCSCQCMNMSAII